MVTWDDHMGWVTWDGHMVWSHGMVSWDGSYGMVELSSSLKTGGYYQNVWYTNIRQNFKNTLHGNAIFSGLTYAGNLIPIRVGQACPWASFMFPSLLPHITRSTIETAPKLANFCVGKSYWRNTQLKVVGNDEMMKWWWWWWWHSKPWSHPFSKRMWQKWDG